jgi:hypothetical protein
MLTADCQNSRGKGKTLGLHSTVFSESNAENTPLNDKNQDKKPKNVRNCESSVNVSGKTSRMNTCRDFLEVFILKGLRGQKTGKTRQNTVLLDRFILKDLAE